MKAKTKEIIQDEYDHLNISDEDKAYYKAEEKNEKRTFIIVCMGMVMMFIAMIGGFIIACI